MRVDLRHIDAGKGYTLGEIALEDDAIESVFALFRCWGLYYEGEQVDPDDLSGQFVVDDRGAHFEVIIDS